MEKLTHICYGEGSPSKTLTLEPHCSWTNRVIPCMAWLNTPGRAVWTNYTAYVTESDTWCNACKRGDSTLEVFPYHAPFAREHSPASGLSQLSTSNHQKILLPPTLTAIGQQTLAAGPAEHAATGSRGVESQVPTQHYQYPQLPPAGDQPRPRTKAVRRGYQVSQQVDRAPTLEQNAPQRRHNPPQESEAADRPRIPPEAYQHPRAQTLPPENQTLARVGQAPTRAQLRQPEPQRDPLGSENNPVVVRDDSPSPSPAPSRAKSAQP